MPLLRTGSLFIEGMSVSHSLIHKPRICRWKKYVRTHCSNSFFRAGILLQADSSNFSIEFMSWNNSKEITIVRDSVRGNLDWEYMIETKLKFNTLNEAATEKET